MPRFLHTMVRITDPEKSRAFYEALGFRFDRDMDIVRDGQLEATNYFFSLGDQESVLELTYNHDGRTYELGAGYGHIAVGVDDLERTLAELKERGIEPERPSYSVREGGSLICFFQDPEGYRIEPRPASDLLKLRCWTGVISPLTPACGGGEYEPGTLPPTRPVPKAALSSAPAAASSVTPCPVNRGVCCDEAPYP